MSYPWNQYQDETKYVRDKLGEDVRVAQPPLYKTYPRSERIELPPFKPQKPATLDGILKRRRSVRHYRPQPLELEQLGYLLWATTAIERREKGYKFRTAPSAGALYPIETYIIAHVVGGLEPGLYHYAVQDHQLERLRSDDLREATAAAALDQNKCAAAPAVFAWTAIFQRTAWKYARRTYRYVYLDAGHVAENLALAAVGLGLGTCQIGAFYDEEVNALLGVDGTEETIVYMSTVGVPA